ncbi:MAG: carbamoyltransferase C-terminal domain-containing protein, partial [Nitrosopumilaceae archaeon]
VQHLLEKCVLQLVDYLTSISNNSKLCLAGGVALNIDMNGAILKSGLIKEMFVQPAAHDSGCALGAALYLHRQYSSKKSSPMKHAYWGPEYSNDEIKQDIIDSGLRYHELDDVAAEIADLISKNKMVGWMQGRAEFGPRALGNRSLLANPTKPDMWKKVNKIKKREYWRPLAPSIIEDKVDEFFVNHNNMSSFMLLKFQVKENKIAEIPAVVHVDGSARPQTVSKETNILYWNLINEFEKIQGVPVLLNTSLNLKGEPLVNNPQDALEALFFSDIDYLCIGKYLVYN